MKVTGTGWFVCGLTTLLVPLILNQLTTVHAEGDAFDNLINGRALRHIIQDEDMREKATNILEKFKDENKKNNITRSLKHRRGHNRHIFCTVFKAKSWCPTTTTTVAPYNSYLDDGCYLRCESQCLRPACPILPASDNVTKKPGEKHCAGPPECPQDCKLTSIPASTAWPDKQPDSTEKSSSDRRKRQLADEGERASEVSDMEPTDGASREADVSSTTTRKPTTSTDMPSSSTTTTTSSSKESSTSKKHTHKTEKVSSTPKPSASSTEKPSTTKSPGSTDPTTSEPPSTTVSPKSGADTGTMKFESILKPFFVKEDIWSVLEKSLRQLSKDPSVQKDAEDVLVYLKDPLGDKKKGKSRSGSAPSGKPVHAVLGHIMVPDAKDCPDCAPCRSDSFSCPNLRGCDIHQCVCGDKAESATKSTSTTPAPAKSTPTSTTMKAKGSTSTKPTRVNSTTKKSS